MFSRVDINTDKKPWNILPIRNGLKCIHESGLYQEYFEADELNGERAFSEYKPLTALQVFNRLMKITPYSKGFIYKNWNIVNKDSKGFVICPRLKKDNMDIEKYQDRSIYERYKSNESLDRFDMSHFLIYLEQDEDYGRNNNI